MSQFEQKIKQKSITSRELGIPQFDKATIMRKYVLFTDVLNVYAEDQTEHERLVTKIKALQEYVKLLKLQEEEHKKQLRKIKDEMEELKATIETDAPTLANAHYILCVDACVSMLKRELMK